MGFDYSGQCGIGSVDLLFHREYDEIINHIE